MPKLARSVPSYRRHKQSGQAIVTLAGRDHLLGPYGSPASQEKYNRVVAEWMVAGRQSRPTDAAAAITVAEIIAGYWDHAQGYYRRADGTPTDDTKSIKKALGPLRRLYAPTEAAVFGPLALKAARDEMIRMGWCRTYINSQIGRIRRMFKWAVENELVPPAVHQGLVAVVGLKAGRCEAPESAPVRAISTEVVDATLPFVSRQVAAMIRVQLLTGMRPGEVCLMRCTELDMSGDLWRYAPSSHKTAHHGHERLIYLGSRSQEIIKPFLKADVQAFLFSPADAEAERRVSRKRGKRDPQKRPGQRYTVTSYCRAIQRACAAAFPPPDHLARRRVEAAGRKHKSTRRETTAEWKTRLGPELWAALKAWRQEHRWHPHQLRHTAATELRRKYGLEAAQVILGHKQLTVTQVYAEKNVAAAEQIMRQVG